MGHHTYWGQFPGLLDEMHRKLAHLTARLERLGVEVRDFGLVDSAQGAYELLPRSRRPTST